MVSKLHVVVWRGSGCASESKRSRAEGFDYQIAECAIERFQDAGFVEDHAVVIGGIEMLQHLVICDRDFIFYRLTGGFYVDAELVTFANGLLSHGKRSKNQELPRGT